MYCVDSNAEHLNVLLKIVETLTPGKFSHGNYCTGFLIVIFVSKQY